MPGFRQANEMNFRGINGPGLATAILIGSLGTAALGMEPVMLSAMVQDGRISEATVGALVTTELLAIAMGTIVGTRLLSRFPAPVVGIVAAVLTAASNALAIGRSGNLALIALRGLAGLVEGVLMALSLVAISRASAPERASGLFLAAQTFIQLIAITVASNLRLFGSGTDACLAILAGCGLAAAFVSLIAPRHLDPPKSETGGGGLTVRDMTGLVAVGAFTGATICVWGYLGLWFAHHAFPAAIASKAVAISLFAQIMGALSAARFGRRLSPRPTILAATLLTSLVILQMKQAQHNMITFYALSAAFSFLWLFTLPAFAGLLVEIDPTRRALLYIAAFQLAGAASLPLLAGVAIGYGGIAGVFYLSIGVLCLAMALVVTLRGATPGMGAEDLHG